MNVLETTQYLVNEGLIMCVGERLTRTDDRVEVSFEEFNVEVDRVKVVLINDIHVVQANNLY